MLYLVVSRGPFVGFKVSLDFNFPFYFKYGIFRHLVKGFMRWPVFPVARHIICEFQRTQQEPESLPHTTTSNWFSGTFFPLPTKFWIEVWKELTQWSIDHCLSQWRHSHSVLSLKESGSILGSNDDRVSDSRNQFDSTRIWESWHLLGCQGEIIYSEANRTNSS